VTLQSHVCALPLLRALFRSLQVRKASLSRENGGAAASLSIPLPHRPCRRGAQCDGPCYFARSARGPAWHRLWAGDGGGASQGVVLTGRCMLAACVCPKTPHGVAACLQLGATALRAWSHRAFPVQRKHCIAYVDCRLPTRGRRAPPRLLTRRGLPTSCSTAPTAHHVEHETPARSPSTAMRTRQVKAARRQSPVHSISGGPHVGRPLQRHPAAPSRI
jgi:hypothetical protein